MRSILLASTSTSRKTILETLGIDFQVVSSNLDELGVVTPPNIDRSQHLAAKKAEVVAALQPTSLVLAADTVVYCDGQLLEKPNSLFQAKEMLTMISNREITVHTGMACAIEQLKESVLVKVSVKMCHMTSAQIATYTQTQPVLTWSGGFSPANPAGLALVAQVSGSITAFTHGLDIPTVTDWLQKYENYSI